MALWLVLPLPASADWQPVGPPVAQRHHLGGYDLKRIHGVSYVAWSERLGGRYVLRVARFDSASARWLQVASIVNHDPRQDAVEPSLAVSPEGVPWIAWSETDRDGVPEIRAAHLGASGTRWVEPDRRDFATSYLPEDWPLWGMSLVGAADLPSLAFLGKRAYIIYRGNNPSEWQLNLVRLADNRHSWRLVAEGVATAIPRPGGPTASVLQGALYIATHSYFDSSVITHLDPNGAWRAFHGPLIIKTTCGSSFGDGVQGIAAFNGAVHALWDTETEDGCGGQYAGQAYVSRYRADGSSEIIGGGAIAPDAWGTSIRVIGGHLYAAWLNRGPSGKLHVSRLADDGHSWIATPDPTRAPGYGSAILSGVGGVPYLATTDTVGSTTRLLVERLDGAEPPIGLDDGEGSGPGVDPHIKTIPVFRKPSGLRGLVLQRICPPSRPCRTHRAGGYLQAIRQGRWFALPFSVPRSGRFRIDLPPGRYVIRHWSPKTEKLGRVVAKVRVTAGRFRLVLIYVTVH